MTRWKSCLLSLALLPYAAGAVAQSADPRAAAVSQLDRGTAAFRAGDVVGATQAWSDAIRLCRAAGARDLEAQALARRGEAYRVAGYFREAVTDLNAALSLAEHDGDQNLVAASSGALGNLALLLRRSAVAEPLLRRAHDIAVRIGDPALAAASSNDLGNLYATLGRRAEAQRAYREAVTGADAARDATLAATAQINDARLDLQRGDAAPAAGALASAVQRLEQQAPSYARGMALIAAGSAAFERDGAPSAELQATAYRAFRLAGDESAGVHNPTLASLAQGGLGRLYERTGRLDDAATLTDRALFEAQKAGAPELTFRWSWQRARLARQRGQIATALAEYRAADAALQKARPDIPIEYRAGRSSYRNAFGPFYLEFADLLLRQSAAGGGGAIPLIREARDTVEQLKESELQDYFQDSCVTSFAARQQSIDAVAPGTAILYPIVLSDRLELLVSVAGEQRQITLPLSEPSLRDQVNRLRPLLEKRTTNEYLPLAQQLYNEILRPVEPLLTQHRIDTLVVVPDGVLRTIPFAALHDGKGFIVERYAVAVAPSLHLTDPRPLTSQSRQALVLGISQAVQGFEGLPNVKREVEEVHDTEGGEVLLDNQFVRARFESELKRAPFGVVHIASHGQFGDDPSQTFVVAYDGHLTMDDLERTIKYGEFRENALELLTLDACETAAGDDRAALGLAGIALKSGARSALATLWFISDKASGDLVVKFYAALKPGNVSKAHALQAAQRQLIADPRYAHPAYWAPFLLIGNWL
ncbi:MAG: CHAT domain-containing protein [Alphaproteobacteria bacterium]|nr:CHAT domain-containing protein [Alphaproteobacteria bacterium]